MRGGDDHFICYSSIGKQLPCSCSPTAATPGCCFLARRHAAVGVSKPSRSWRTATLHCAIKNTTPPTISLLPSLSAAARPPRSPAQFVVIATVLPNWPRPQHRPALAHHLSPVKPPLPAGVTDTAIFRRQCSAAPPRAPSPWPARSRASPFLPSFVSALP
jgi:hypothetical protein